MAATPQLLLRTHKIRLAPNQAQSVYFQKAVGVARFAYNWALGEWQRQYEAYLADTSLPKPNEGALRKKLNAIKREQFPWMLEVTKCAPQEAIIQLGEAYKNWFASLSGKRKGPKMQAPKFKKKGRSKDAFKIHGELVAVEDSRIRIPLLGWVRMRESLRFNGKIMSVTVSRTADAWFAAITVETSDIPEQSKSHAAVGIDLGVNTLATLSDGTSFQGPRALKMLMDRLRRLSKSHSRKCKGSSNRRKSAAKLAKLHWRISNIRNDAIHKLTHQVTKDYGWVAIEDLNVRGMLRGNVAKSVSDASFGEIRRQLTYKAEMRAVVLETVDRWYPSSKTCSECGTINTELKRGQTAWTCSCGAVHDRDLNAAKNILVRSMSDWNVSDKAAGAVASACGAEGSGSGRKTRVKPSATKQEVNHYLAEAAI